MCDNNSEVPEETVTYIDPETVPFADGPLFLVTANTGDGLTCEVVDVRGEASDAFPPRTAESRVVTDTASLLAEVERRPLLGGQSTVWGNRKTGEVTVVYNDLQQAADDNYTARDDRLTLRFVPDPDWATLHKAADGKFHGQDEFGDLIESAGHLITSHPAAELMEMIDSVRASSKGAFESRIRRDTGTQHLTYSEEVSVKAGSSSRALEVPREITLTARPFEDYPEVSVTCWLRLRINGGQLHLGLFPQPYEHLVRAAWTHVTRELSDKLEVPIYAVNLPR